MPAVFAAEHRRTAIVLIAVWLIMLQAFLAGLATARAGAMSASSPIDATICHGAGDGDPTDRTVPLDPAWHLCCASCMSAASPLLSSGAPETTVLQAAREPRAPAFAGFTLVPPHGVIRAGSSQAPPNCA